MDGYTKLHAVILDSSIWLEPTHVRIVWITMLAMADANGLVEASVRGLAARARVSDAECREALERLSGPDPDSRDGTTGERIREEEPGVWFVINHGRYRERQTRAQALAAARVRRHRSKVDGSVTCNDVTDGNARLRAPVYVSVSDGSSGTGESAREEPTAAQRKWVPRPDDVSEPVWQDWVDHRKAMKAPFSATALAQTRTEAAKAGMTLEQALSTAMASGWRGFRAEYVRDRAPAKSGKGVIPKDLSKEDWGESGPI